MAWKAALAIAIALAVVAAGAATATPPAAASAGVASVSTNLVGSQWRFVEVEGVPVPPDVRTILRLRDGRASGRAGCNSFGAAWELMPAGRIRFSQLMSTKMACLEPAGAMQVEHGVVAALRHAARVEHEGERLVLLDAAGKRLAALEPASTR